MAKQSFFQLVYVLVKRIPVGQVTTYGQLAHILGTRDARRVGHALHANKDPDCPCHRVVFSDGRVAPSYAFGGPNEQHHRLKAEGITFTLEEKVNLQRHLWNLSEHQLRNSATIKPGERFAP